MNARPERQMYLNLKDTTTTIKSMDIENLNADPSMHGHQKRKGVMITLTIGITTQDIAIITIKNMDISLRITLEHISEEIIVDG